MQLKSVSKAFRKQKVLSNINLEIKRGRILGIVGASGSGKTTLLNTITGNYLPDKGDILFEPKDIASYSHMNPSEHLQSINKSVFDLKRTVGYSPQDPSFYDKLTCKENLDFFGSLQNVPREILKINIKIILKLVGLDKYSNKLAGELSGGMQKRLDLACALVHDPKILVLDEPTSDLDFVLRNQMWDLIRKISDKGTTIIMSSHFIDEIEGICDNIIILNNNAIEFQGSPKELKRRENAETIIKLATEERNYEAIKKIISKNHKNASFEYDNNTGYFIIIFRKLPKSKSSPEKVINMLKGCKQNIKELIYTKEGISEMFKELTSNDPEMRKKGNLLSEVHKPMELRESTKSKKGGEK
ncbi:MAG: ABC transporter ATP-binding protein [Nanobdellota archaeon]